MFRYETRVPGSGDLQVATTKGWSDGFNRFLRIPDEAKRGKKMMGKNMAFVAGEGSDSFVTHSFDSDPSPGPQSPRSESPSSPRPARHERFLFLTSRSPGID